MLYVFAVACNPFTTGQGTKVAINHEALMQSQSLLNKEQNG